MVAPPSSSCALLWLEQSFAGAERQPDGAAVPLWSPAAGVPFCTTCGASLLKTPWGTLLAPQPQPPPPGSPGQSTVGASGDAGGCMVGGGAGAAGSGRGFAMRSQRFKGVYRMHSGR